MKALPFFIFSIGIILSYFMALMGIVIWVPLNGKPILPENVLAAKLFLLIIATAILTVILTILFSEEIE